MNAPDTPEAVSRIPGITLDGGEPVFNEPWEAQVFAITVMLNEKGIFSWTDWANRFGNRLAENTANGEPLTYYEVWLENLEDMVRNCELVSGSELNERSNEWQSALLATPHGQPIELKRANTSN